jgi:single-stranded-DNA-specific exonuclease
MGGGLTVARDGLEAAMERLGELLARQGAGGEGPRTLRIDALVMPGAATPDLVEEIETAGPFGQSAPAPRFVLPALSLSSRRVGEQHLRVTGTGEGGARIEAVAFGAFEGPLGPALEGAGHRRFHLAGRLELNHWGGRTWVQLRLEDACPAAD